MKHNIYTFYVIALTAVTATAAATAVSFVSPRVQTTAYVRRDENIAPTTQHPLINAGTFDIPAGTAQNVVINIFDTRIPIVVQRNGRTSSDVLLKTASGTAAFNSGATIN